MQNPTTEEWVAWLFERHQASLTFTELRRAVQAVSAAYVERRDKRQAPKALDSAGKRAAFAAFFAPLHFWLVREIVQSLGAATGPRDIVDLGCGTGVAGLAWALAAEQPVSFWGIDSNRWAVGEAQASLDFFGVSGRAVVGDFVQPRRPLSPCRLVAGFAINELDDARRVRLLPHLLAAAQAGSQVLIVEPIARRPVQHWWPAWETAFRAQGGHAAEWRFPVELPKPLKELDRAAGLNHRELSARTLALGW